MPLNDGTELVLTDLFSLALKPLSARVRALDQAWQQPEELGPLPSRAVQIAGLIIAETVRLIRVGGRAELAEGALELTQLVVRPDSETLAVDHPESFRLASGASVVLGVANAPSSGGGELAVLRSWNGRAREAVELLNQAHGKAIPRSELRQALGDLTESHLSHLLADLEASGLAVRIREGKTVVVHLGPTGRGDLVQGQLSSRELPDLKYRGPARDVDDGVFIPMLNYDASTLVKIVGASTNGRVRATAPHGFSSLKRGMQLRYLHGGKPDQLHREESQPASEHIAASFQAHFARLEEGDGIGEAVSHIPAVISSDLDQQGG